MKKMHPNGYVPKDIFKLLLQKKPLDKIRWKMKAPNLLSSSFCMYYEGGQWRNIIVHYHLITFDYTFHVTYYYPSKRKTMGKEITKEEWEKLGHSVSSSSNPAGEMLPPNTLKALQWLTKKGLLVKIEKDVASLLTEDYRNFEMNVRLYESVQNNYNKKQCMIMLGDCLTVSENIELFTKYLEQYPTKRVWNQNASKLLYSLDPGAIPHKVNIDKSYSINDIPSNKINPEHLVQIKQIFFGVVNVNPV